MINILRFIIWIINFLLAAYAAYFVLISFCSLLPQKKQKKFEPKHKFAAIIAARNEELVIGNLIDSLQNQKYPKELFDIIVIPNNCTDSTREIALSKNAKIFDCKGIIKSKGDALNEFFYDILKHEDFYDGFCIFDADNVVCEDFLSEMNDAMCRGVRIGQGYRDSKNPCDTVISSCYSIYYYIVNRLQNRARSAINLSSIINGSGFMVSADVIKMQKGWHTKTMTEDTEFTIKCILAGEKVQWIPDAVIYDEQPLTFGQSWKQRKRWSTGLIQVLELYVAQLAKNAITQKNIVSFDLLLFFISPVMQLLCIVSAVLTVVLTILCEPYAYFFVIEASYQLFLSLIYSYALTFAVALLIVLLERKKISKMLKGIITFWFFILSWQPINILCMFKKETEWTQIKHTRGVKINELVSEEN